MQAVCKIEFTHAVDKEILMVDFSPITPLPAGVTFQPMVVCSHAMDINSFRVWINNYSFRETAIPMGTVIGHMHLVDSIATIPPKETTSS